jgi:L-ascorbate metabolism protein UlaG (beta-lactamase superfamily)
MQVEWYGQSAFRLTDGSMTVFIAPLPRHDSDARPRHALGLPRDRRRQGRPAARPPTSTSTTTASRRTVTLRSTAGRLESPIGEVLGVASEHDEVAGTERGANTLFVSTLAGRRVAHLGDLGQRAA